MGKRGTQSPTSRGIERKGNLFLFFVPVYLYTFNFLACGAVVLISRTITFCQIGFQVHRGLF